MTDTKNIQYFQDTVRHFGGLAFMIGPQKLDIYLARAHGFMNAYGLNEPLQQEIERAFGKDPWPANWYVWGDRKASLLLSIEWGLVKLAVDEKEAIRICTEVFNYFSFIAPKGFYFGPKYETDNVTYGWWRP